MVGGWWVDGGWMVGGWWAGVAGGVGGGLHLRVVVSRVVLAEIIDLRWESGHKSGVDELAHQRPTLTECHGDSPLLAAHQHHDKVREGMRRWEEVRAGQQSHGNQRAGKRGHRGWRLCSEGARAGAGG